ncbi:MAG: acyl-CoA dehydrogenase family protein, partial [Caulobacterales bacterium]
MTNVLNTPRASYLDEELDMFRDAVERFVRQECVPHIDEWREASMVDRSVWKKAGEAGLLMASAPEEYGGAGGTFAHETIILETLARLG